MQRKSLFFAMIVLIIGALILSGCGRNAPAASEEGTRPVPVEVQEVEIGELQIISTYSGTVNPLHSVMVTPKLNGRIAQVLVKDGDLVQAGDTLVKLETTDIASQVDQAKVGYDLAVLQLEKVKAGTRREQLEQSRAALSISQAQYDAAKVAAERHELLYQSGAIPRQQLEQVKTQYQVAAAQLKQAEESLAMAEKGATAEDVRLAEAQVTQAEVALRNARTQLDNTVITAPIGGVVSGFAAKVGEMASPTMPLAVVNQLDKVEVQVQLTEKDINHVQVGQGTSVQVTAAASEPFTGKITSISPVADSRTRTFLMKVEVANEAGMLKGGMSARVAIVIEEETEGIVIPLSTILQENGQRIVYVVNNQVAEKRPVTLGLSNDQKVVITSGLEVSELLVVKGQHYLEDSSPVAIVGGGNSR